MIKTIYLAGGCFWGVQAYFSHVKGIIDSKVGYANGLTKKTTYQQIKFTQHAETLQLKYDSDQISLEEIILHLFRFIEPDSLNKQGVDTGIQYRTGVYYLDEIDFLKINKLFEILKKDYKEFYVELKKLDNFCLAEEYHQNYLVKNPLGYCHVNLLVDFNLTNKEKEILDLLK
ncbi:peptide-methionine (S)-S-oxide reductase MsrA [Metamycoplasma canadense]|uniref:Peptide methionine sulfoxide reductase MsrA n=1 Tax=Metamycoplasma canadense TaxID=29554 RepID=A0A077L5X1_9BACT|nr:peptide-methionine (S)-S-oxide reductase MsrA [Metamycoplasma canadense]BAP39685.1 peptide methionine sulfoxide reductase [Metamycoplasma canadense]